MNKRIGQQRVSVDGRADEWTEEKTINVYVLFYPASDRILEILIGWDKYYMQRYYASLLT